jgi:hypothetical protein
MAQRNVMLDLETLGKRPGAKILTIGARDFDLSGPAAGFFYGRIDRDLWKPSFHEDPDTLAWWEEQVQEARDEAFGGTDDPARVLSDFAAWFKASDVATAWCKGTHFDVTILEAAFHEYGIPVPWVYNAPRCMRSVVNTLDPDYRENAAHLTGGLLPHHALADSDRQTFELVTALNKYGLPIR